MRVREKVNGVSVHAISGTHVVCLGLNSTKKATKGLLGFAISRTDAEGETKWFRAGRRFEQDKGLKKTPDSRQAPIQMFFWGDYTAEPANTYTYTVIPIYGEPGALEQGEPVELEVTTEDTDNEQHGIFFNRGVAGSQSYARKFGKYRKWYEVAGYGGRTDWKAFIKPEDVPGDKAYKWLTRGLEDAMLGFIKQAKNKKFGLRAAVYEFNHKPVLQAFVDALEKGVDVKITYDAKRSGKHETGPWRETEAALRGIGVKYYRNRDKKNEMMIQRTNATISHNKFIVLLEDGEPTQVWTGSTNFTRGGIYGQSNVGHIIRDPEVAAHYLAYWEQLATNPQKGSKSKPGLRQWNVEQQPDLTELPPKGSMTPIFSPRPSVGMLEWYADRIANAKQSVHFTAAFGVAQQIAQHLVDPVEVDGPYMRYVMLESKPSKKSSDKRKDAARAKGRPVPLDYYDLVENQQNAIAWGQVMRKRWVKEGQERYELEEALTGLDTHVNFLHTKYMIVDPLTDDPLVITGSANFSDASTKDNDENMLVIRGNKRVADIFLGEFMRLFRHFRFRNEDAELSDEEAAEQWLVPDNSWTKPYYVKDSQEETERKLFA